MGGVEDLRKLGLRTLPYSSLAYLLLLIIADAYLSATKAGSLYLHMLDIFGSRLVVALFVAVQGIVALCAPLIGFVSDRWARRFRRSLLPLIGMVAGFTGFLIVGYLSTVQAASGLSVVAFPLGLVLIYFSVIAVEVPALAVIVDDFPPYQRLVVVSITMFAYLAAVSASFMVNAYLVPAEALTLPTALIPAAVMASLILVAVAVRHVTHRSGEGLGVGERLESARVTSFGEAVRVLGRVKGIRELYVSLFLMYIVFTAVTATLAPVLCEELEGWSPNILWFGTPIPESIERLTYVVEVLFNIGAMLGALAFVPLSKLMDYRKVPLIGEVLFITCIIFGVHLATTPAGFALAALSGFGFGSFIVFTILYPSLAAEPLNPGVIYGFYTLSYSLAYVAGPFLAFGLHAVLHSFRIVYAVLAIPIIISIAAGMRILR